MLQVQLFVLYGGCLFFTVTESVEGQNQTPCMYSGHSSTIQDIVRRFMVYSKTLQLISYRVLILGLVAV